jgi:D-lactate dehydrogenase
MKIAFFELFKHEQEILEKFFPDYDVSYSGEKLTIENVNLYKEVEIISVFTNSVINKEIIDLLPNLKLVNTSSTGYDHIDIEYCKSKNIKVSNVPSYGSITVAEFTFTLLLGLSRKIIKANNQLRQDDSFNIIPLKGFDLNGKTLGVIGTGRIGKNVIKIAKGFGMNVIACNKSVDKSLEAELGFTYKDFSEIISEADIITLHAPFCEENRHLINKEVIKKMKKGVYLINTARGELVDTGALIWGLKEGIIAGAGLDVLEGERSLKEEIKVLSSPQAMELKDYKVLVEDHVLIDMPNVIVTPHIAFYSKEAEHEIIKTTEENIKNFADNQPQNLVN